MTDRISAATKRLPFWGDLTDDEKAFVCENSTIRTYEKGRLIHGGDSDCLGMTLVLSGEVRAFLLSDEGREVTLFRLREGDPCVLSASCVISQITFESHITAVTDCELLIVNSGAFSMLTDRNVYVRCFMYELMMKRFSSVMLSMQDILFKGYDRRLATFLVGEYDRTGLPVVRMTHEQIAQHTSSAREVVARMLKRFSADGLVEVKRGTIRISEPESLRALV
jgi:CRP/FNR family transcriptional regulator